MSYFKKDFSLKDYTTFHIDAKAEYFAEYGTDEQLVSIIEESKLRELRMLVLGGGANILFTQNFKGVVIHPLSSKITIDNDVVIADAGVKWDTLVETTIQHGLGGLENLSFIPGTVGASPVQNIGAYGVEVKDTILWVEYLDIESMEVKRISNAECEFGYRDSIFKNKLKGKIVILRVAFKLQYESSDYDYKLNYGALESEVITPTIGNIRDAVIKIRKSKLPDPDVLGNAGSFFRNPEIGDKIFEFLKSEYPQIVGYGLPSGKIKVSAGWLIENAGWKGKSLGRAGVHEKQALVLVNNGGATGMDICILCDQIISDVYEKFGITLSPEVNIF